MQDFRTFSWEIVEVWNERVGQVRKYGTKVNEILLVPQPAKF